MARTPARARASGPSLRRGALPDQVLEASRRLRRRRAGGARHRLPLTPRRRPAPAPRPPLGRARRRRTRALPAVLTGHGRGLTPAMSRADGLKAVRPGLRPPRVRTEQEFRARALSDSA